jgi:hypothetical protein
MRFLLTTVTLALCVGSAHAQSQADMAVVFPPFAHADCAAIAKLDGVESAPGVIASTATPIDAVRLMTLEAWLIGFVDGENILDVAAGADVTNHKSPTNLAQVVIDFCKAKPQADFGDVTRALITMIRKIAPAKPATAPQPVVPQEGTPL